MIGSLLVFGCIVIALLIALSMGFGGKKINFLLIGVLFVWSSLSYFLVNNYLGWPSESQYPKAQVVGIEIVTPTPEKKGAIFIWVYHAKVDKKKFFEYNPTDIPRAYKIEYTDKANEAFSEAKELMEKGYIVMVGADPEEGNGDGNGEDKPKGEKMSPYGTDAMSLNYDDDMPELWAINPQSVLRKE